MDGTILGYVRYPGGSIPLSESFFIQPSSLRISKSADAFSYVNYCPITAIRSVTSASIASTNVNVTTDAFTTNTPLATGWAVQASSTGTLPSPLVAGTTYYVVNATSSSFQLSTIQSGTAIDLTTTGTGTHTFTGMWSESVEYALNEACSRFVNNAPAASTYTLRFPFVITSAGQPQKVVARLLVDFHCLVTFAINLKGTTISLSPNSGLVSNTGTLITREFNIPTGTSSSWEAGTTAFIEISIESQPSRGVSFAYVGLTQEPTPFTLFT